MGRDSKQKDPWIEFKDSTNLDRKKNYIFIFTNLSLEFSISFNYESKRNRISRACDFFFQQ